MSNALQWDGVPGHYEVYYLSATDPDSGLGFWIRYTLLAPLEGEATCSLWLMAMDPQLGRTHAYKETLPVDRLEFEREPFKLSIGAAELSDYGMTGTIGDVSWDLSWQPTLPSYDPVHPLLRRAKLAKTMYVLSHPDLTVSGRLRIGGITYEVEAARGGQAHLWGLKHAPRWAWLHCNDLRTEAGERCEGSFVDGVSVYLNRMGRELGPATPFVGRVMGEDFFSTRPAAVMRNGSEFGVDGWQFQVRDGARGLRGSVTAPRAQLVGVTYADPDGEPAYCYNTEVASLRLDVLHRQRRRLWTPVETLVSSGSAHFEYAQREPLPDIDPML